MPTPTQPSTQLLYVHRHLPDGGEVYWVNSRNAAAQTLVAFFRVAGKVPQFWHPETGKMEPVSYTIADGLTNVMLPLAPNDAVFVLFRNGTTKTSLTLPVVAEEQVMAVAGPWQIAFQPNPGAPANTVFDKLTSYSGTSGPCCGKMTSGEIFFGASTTHSTDVSWYGSLEGQHTRLRFPHLPWMKSRSTLLVSG